MPRKKVFDSPNLATVAAVAAEHGFDRDVSTRSQQQAPQAVAGGVPSGGVSGAVSGGVPGGAGGAQARSLPSGPTASVPPVSPAAPLPGARSGTATPAGQVRRPKRHRTGRDQQMNLKVSTQCRTDLESIADQNDWGLGETLEYLIAHWQDHRAQ